MKLHGCSIRAMVTSYGHVRHRNRRILRYLNQRPAAPTEISEALDIPLVSVRRRLRKLRRERAVFAEYGCVYITRRGSEMAGDAYIRRPGREHLGSATEGRSETPGRRARIPSQRHRHRRRCRQLAAHAPIAKKTRPSSDCVPVGGGLWLMPDGTYVLRQA